MITPNSIVSNDKTKMAIDIVIIVAIIYVLYKVLNVFGKTAEGVTGIVEGITTNVGTAPSQSVVDKANEGLATIGQKPTKTPAELQSIANTIFEDGRVFNVGGIDTDTRSIVHELTKMQNDADVLTLVKYFGVRGRYTFGIQTKDNMDLFTWLRDVLDNSEIQEVNSNWSRKKPLPIKARL
jgi:hypothetical protein